MPRGARRASPRVLVLGAGSAGSRHARHLASAGGAVDIADPDADRAARVQSARVVPFDLDSLEGYDGIVVASPTRFHEEQTIAALSTGARVLVEKPMATDLAAGHRVVEAGGDRLMVGYNLRLHAPIAELVRRVKSGDVGRVFIARLWFGSYLPDWRPDVDYRTTYSAHAILGGGVLLDAIHELDLLVWLLGTDVQVTSALVARVGDLDIDVEDTAIGVFRASSGAVAHVSLDYLSRRYRRGIEVVGDEATIRFDWARQALEVEQASGVEVLPALEPVTDSYRHEAERFMRWIRNDEPPPVDGPTGLASLRLAHEMRALS